jgi:hypothetical protein
VIVKIAKALRLPRKKSNHSRARLTEEEKRALDIQHDVGVEIYDIKKRNIVFSFASDYQQQNFAWKKLQQGYPSRH